MASTEEKVIKTTKDFKGKASSLQIAKELGISPGYTNLILQDLQRKGKIKLSAGRVSIKKEVSASDKLAATKPKRKSKKPKRKKTKSSLTGLKGITKQLEKILKKAGYRNIKTLAEAPIAKLMDGTGLVLKQAADLINEAKRKLKIIGDHGTKENDNI